MISSCLSVEMALSCIFQLLVVAVINMKYSEASFVFYIDIEFICIHKDADKISIEFVSATVAEDAVVKNGLLLVG